MTEFENNLNFPLDRGCRQGMFDKQDFDLDLDFVVTYVHRHIKIPQGQRTLALIVWLVFTTKRYTTMLLVNVFNGVPSDNENVYTEHLFIRMDIAVADPENSERCGGRGVARTLKYKPPRSADIFLWWGGGGRY